MTVTVDTFRAAFPVFADKARYADPQVQFWLDLASNLHDANRWGNLLDFGTQLFIAHNLSVDAGIAAAASAGDVPGAVEGPVTNGSVDKVSYGRQLTDILEPGAGHWNLTVYGLRYRRLVLKIGAGPILANVGPVTNDGLSASAWNGPYPYYLTPTG